MTATERVYRIALLAYPRAYREERGDEIIGTLLERDGDVRSGEMASLVFEGVAQRGRIAHAGSDAAAVRAGLRLGGFVLLWLFTVVESTDIAFALQTGRVTLLELGTTVVSIAALLAATRGRWALPLLLVCGNLAVLVVASGSAGAVWTRLATYSFNAPVVAGVMFWLAPALLIYLGRPRDGEPDDRRSWWWVPAAAAVAAVIRWEDLFFTSWLGRPLVVVLVVWIVVGRRDLRLAVAGAVVAAVPAAEVLVSRYSVAWISPQPWVGYVFVALAVASVAVSVAALRESEKSSRTTQ